MPTPSKRRLVVASTVAATLLHALSELTGRLRVATADTGKLIEAAMLALGAIWRPGRRYKKAGTVFLELVPAGRMQTSLFDQPDDTRSTSRMMAMDALNRRFGRGTVGYGTAGEGQGWTLRREFVSPRYTTAGTDLLRVR